MIAHRAAPTRAAAGTSPLGQSGPSVDLAGSPSSAPSRTAEPVGQRGVGGPFGAGAGPGRLHLSRGALSPARSPPFRRSPAGLGAPRGAAARLGKTMAWLARSLCDSQPVARFQRRCGLFPAGEARALGNGGAHPPARDACDGGSLATRCAACNGSPGGAWKVMGSGAGLRQSRGEAQGLKRPLPTEERGRWGTDAAALPASAGGQRITCLRFLVNPPPGIFHALLAPPAEKLRVSLRRAG